MNILALFNFIEAGDKQDDRPKDDPTKPQDNEIDNVSDPHGAPENILQGLFGNRNNWGPGNTPGGIKPFAEFVGLGAILLGAGVVLARSGAFGSAGRAASRAIEI